MYVGIHIFLQKIFQKSIESDKSNNTITSLLTSISVQLIVFFVSYHILLTPFLKAEFFQWLRYSTYTHAHSSGTYIGCSVCVPELIHVCMCTIKH